MSGRPRRVLVVCTANLCRSTMAERLIRARLEAEGLSDRVVVLSAGTWAREGLASPPHVVAVLAERGLDASDHRSQEVKSEVVEQADEAIREADAILFLLDAQSGPTAADIEVADRLRRTNKPVIPAANKVENRRTELASSEFYELGLGEPIPTADLTHDQREQLAQEAQGAVARLAAGDGDTGAVVGLNRVGPRLQPGTRSYSRAWIRDGAMIGEGLLRLGREDIAKDFLRWYAPYQFDSGKVPCCVDDRGADPVPENDSHGELIYLVAEVYRYTRDRALLSATTSTVARPPVTGPISTSGTCARVRTVTVSPSTRTASTAKPGVRPSRSARAT